MVAVHIIYDVKDSRDSWTVVRLQDQFSPAHAE